MYVRSEQKGMYRCRIGCVCHRSMCRTEEEKSRRMDEVNDVEYMDIGRLVGSCVAGSALTGIMPSQDFLETWFAPVRDLRQLQPSAVALTTT